MSRPTNSPTRSRAPSSPVALRAARARRLLLPHRGRAWRAWSRSGRPPAPIATRGATFSAAWSRGRRAAGKESGQDDARASSGFGGLQAQRPLLEDRDRAPHPDRRVQVLGGLAEGCVEEQGCRHPSRVGRLHSLGGFSRSRGAGRPRRRPTSPPRVPRRTARRTKLAMERPRSRSVGGCSVASTASVCAGGGRSRTSSGGAPRSMRLVADLLPNLVDVGDYLGRRLLGVVAHGAGEERRLQGCRQEERDPHHDGDHRRCQCSVAQEQRAVRDLRVQPRRMNPERREYGQEQDGGEG